MMMTVFTKFARQSLQLITIAGVFLVVNVGSSYAAGCGAKARSVAAHQGGKVLSARALGDKCRIKILVRQPKGPPKTKTITIRK